MVEVNLTVTPDVRSFQAMAEKFGGEVSKQLSNVNRAMSGGVDRDKQGDPKQNVGQQLGKLAKMMPAGGMLADVGKAFKQGGMMTGVTAGVVSIVGFFKGMLSQSKIFSTVAQTFFKIVGVMLDMMLMPLLPYFMRFLQWWMSKGISWATDMGAKIAVIVPKIIAFFTTTKKVLDAILPFGSFMDWVKRFFIAWFAIWVIQKARAAIKGLTKGVQGGVKALRGLRGGRGAGKAGQALTRDQRWAKALGKGGAKKAGLFGRLGGSLGRGLGGLGRGLGSAGRGIMGAAKGGFGLGALGRRAGRLGGGRVGRIAGRIATRQGIALTARLAGGFIAKRGTSIAAGAAIGGGAGLAAFGVGAIPGALIGAVVGLVIGQATGVAIDAATGKGFDAKRAFVPLYSEVEDTKALLFKKNEETFKENSKEVLAAGTAINQKTQRALEDSTKRTIGNSYIPDTMGSYIGIYTKMEDESGLTKDTVETESRGLVGTILDFFASWPAAIMKVLNAVWGAIWGFFSETLPNAIGAALSAIGDFLGAVWDIGVAVIGAITGALSTAWNAISNFFTSTIPTAVGKVVSGIATWLAKGWDFLAGIWTYITDKLSTAWNAVSNFFTSTIPTAVGKVVSGIASYIAIGYDFLETVWTAITGKLSEIWGAISTFFTDTIPTAVGKVVSGVAEWIGKGFSFAATVWSCITGFLGSVWGAVKGFFTETVPNQAKAVVTKVGEWIGKGFSFASTVWSCITGFLGDVWSSIKTFVTVTIPNSITAVVTGVTTWISGVAALGWTWITTKIKKLADGVKTTVTNLIGNIIPDFDLGILYKFISQTSGDPPDMFIEHLVRSPLYLRRPL